MATFSTVLHSLRGFQATRLYRTALAVTACAIGSCITADLLGYWLHRLLYSSVLGFSMIGPEHRLMSKEKFSAR